MKKLLILSGKGGTGKTTIASAFIELSHSKAFADCDVDAPNLHLIHRSFEHEHQFDYFGMDKAWIDEKMCVGCGICKEMCRFDAIDFNGRYKVNPFSCEGCGVCERVCPVQAIKMIKHKAGDLSLFEGHAVFSTAKLSMGNGTSGMLVTEVKKKLNAQIDADEKKGKVYDQHEYAIIDGSPGIGCPVIASISGVDMVLIVTEPSVSGISDMKRIVETAKSFMPKIAVCINKYDTNSKLSDEIEDYCLKNNIDFVGRVPYDADAVKAVNEGLTIVSKNSLASMAVKDVHEKTVGILFNSEKEHVFNIKRI